MELSAEWFGSTFLLVILGVAIGIALYVAANKGRIWISRIRQIDMGKHRSRFLWALVTLALLVVFALLVAWSVGSLEAFGVR